MKIEGKIRVMIVDDHAVVRSGLSTFLMVYPDFELVGEAENGEEALRECERLKPDVILMDLMMPVMDGVAATRAIRLKVPGTQVIALTSFAEEGLVQGALQAGAVGYLMKNTTGIELAAAIRSAHSGRITLSQEATQVLIHSSTQPVVPGEDLTEREREVLKLMVDGLNNAQIAQKLIVSQSTVKYHIANIFSKLGVENRVEAVRMAIERRLIK